MDRINKSFIDCALDPAPTIYADWTEGEYRCLVMRGPCSLCAYVGVKEGHPLYEKDYLNLDVDCHYGLTYAGMGDDKYRPSGYWWLGWDYGHFGDMAFYDLKDGGGHYDAIAWTPDMVVGEFPEVLASIRRYVENHKE